MTARTPSFWPTILALYAGGLVGALQYAKLAVPLASLQAVYPEAGTLIGWMVSLLSLLGLIFGVVAGGTIARIGFRRSLLAALWAATLLSLLQSLMPPLPVMLGLRVVEGLSHLAIVIAAPTLIAEIASDRDRPAAMTLWGSFFGVAFMLTALLGLPLIAQVGLPGFLILHAGLAALMAVILTLRLPPEAPAAPAPRRFAPLADHVALYRSPFLAAPAMGWLFYTLTFVALLAVLPQALPDDTAYRFSAFAPIAGIVISLTLGTLLLRSLPAITVVMAGFALAALTVPTLLIWPNTALPAIATFAMLGLVQGASFAAVPQLNTSLTDRALGNGALAQMGNAGNLLGTPLMLAVLGLTGLPGMVLLTAGCYIAALLSHAAFARARQRAT